MEVNDGEIDKREKGREAKGIRVTLTGSVINIVLTGLKITAGILGHSQAMVADGIHSFSDLISDIIVVAGLKFASKPRDENHNYGHGKGETLAAAFVGVLLLLLGLLFAREALLALMSLTQGADLAPPEVMALAAALISIAAKEGLFRYTRAAARRLNSSSLEANAWHHRSDALSSIAGAAGITGALILGEKGILLDSIAALIISGMVLKAGLDILKRALGELMEASLPREECQRTAEAIRRIEGVSDLHNMRTRRIGSTAAVDAHIRVDGNLTVRQGHDIASQVEKKLREIHGPEALLSIHVEPRDKEDKSNRIPKPPIEREGGFH